MLNEPHLSLSHRSRIAGMLTLQFSPTVNAPLSGWVPEKS